MGADRLAVPSGKAVRGTLRVPPSKSVTHRYLNLALLAREPTVIEHPLLAQDTLLFLAALERCGFRVERREAEVRVASPASLALRAEIDCGNAGTMCRFLVAALTALPGDWLVDGSPRLRQRPVGPLVAALHQLGARIDYLESEGFPPLRITGGTLVGGEAVLDAGESSQYLSALLMAATRAQREVALRVESLTSSPYVELTREAMGLFAATVEEAGQALYRVRPTRLRSGRLEVEGDYSGAAYPAAAAAVTGGRVLLQGLRRASPQGDRRFLSLLRAMGTAVRWRGEEVEVSGGQLEAVEADLGDMPDQVPTLAALAPFARGTTRILGVPHLRIKESDRLHAMALELGKLGVEVEENPDGLVVHGGWGEEGSEPPSGKVTVDTHGDHRIAMSLALVGLRRPGVVIRDPGVVEKSYPGFWRDLQALCGG